MANNLLSPAAIQVIVNLGGQIDYRPHIEYFYSPSTES